MDDLDFKEQQQNLGQKGGMTTGAICPLVPDVGAIFHLLTCICPQFTVFFGLIWISLLAQGRCVA